MKKKIFITLSLLLLGLSTFYAQNNGLQRRTEGFVDYLDTFNNRPETFLEVYDGTPYNSESFLLGNIYIKGELSTSDVALRYNIYSDEIEIKESLQADDDKRNALIKSPDLSITILRDKFNYIPKGKGLEKGGYFQMLTSGKNYSLCKKLGKKYYPARKAKTSFERDVPARFDDRATYYINFSNGAMVELPGSKKKMYKAFGESENEIKEYAQKNKLDITKEKDLKRIVLYLDNSKTATQQ